MAWYMAHYKERIELFLNDDQTLPAELKGFKFTVNDPGTKGSGDAMQLIVTHEKNDAHFSAILQQYPACCAFEQLNHFVYQGHKGAASVGPILTHYIKTMRQYYRGRFAWKLVLNTVEEHDGDRNAGFHVEDAGEGEFQYPAVHKWATQFEHVDIPVVNHNTSRIIHHIITFPIIKL